MAIQKRFIHFKKFSDFNSKKLSANEANTQYTVGVSGAIQDGEPDILYQSYVWIKDTKQQWTHAQLYGNDYTVDLTYEELKSLRDNSQLVPGQQYRITDYVTTTSQENTRSAGHQFDIIVTADNENTLNEAARACMHEGDTYFSEAGANLAAWQIWYSLDNDTERFAWADGRLYISKYGGYIIKRVREEDFVEEGQQYYAYLSEEDIIVCTKDEKVSIGSIFYSADDISYEFGVVDDISGKGVIYRMIDEWGNDCPYDFKNIQFKNPLDENDTNWKYTFGDSKDYSILGECRNNIIKPYIPYKEQQLNFISMGFDSYGNVFDYDCRNIMLGGQCHNNYFGNSCYNNNIGSWVEYSSFGKGCYHNTMVSYCQNVKFDNTSRFIDLVGSTGYGSRIKNYTLFGGVGGVSHGPTVSRLTINAEPDRDYETKITFNSKGDLRVYCEADLIAPTLINFTIDGTSYTAELGMTWDKWLSSTYNTGNYVNNNNYVGHTETAGSVCKANSQVVTQDFVISNQEYDFVVASMDAGQDEWDE